MVFASPIFLFAFMPLAVGLCMLARWTKRPWVRNGLLLLFSLAFYAWGEPTYVFLMLGAILANYLLAFRVRESRLVFVCAVALDLGMLAVFKYLDLLISAANGLFRLNLPGAHLALPIGISFYTFQILSYVIDVRRGDVPPARNLVDFAAYVSMFPQLIAGPIVRYVDVAADLRRLNGDISTAAAGARRFCMGLAKKVLLANTLASAADTAFGMTGSLNFGGAWAGLIAYALQIYFDFSGYSDMAIGLGKMLGFSFPENFRYPYVSLSVKEFWRRWHLSLSTWFRDYLYIPLGGSRRGKGRTLLNLLIVFALCGLWHGANWTFLLWGLWHGLFLCLERLSFMKKLQEALPKWVRWCYTALVVLLGWVLFRADSLALALQYAGNLFSLEGVWISEVLTVQSGAALLAGIVCCLPLPRPRQNALTETVYTLIALALLAACALCLAGGTYNPFIYFRF
ncbi:MAG: MBOAT family O-acyltransferase [Eubacteriales bacterium]|nr:MBOAT family protein [Clostridiales bacterium]MDD6932588.1 MBOAT family protein [Eubacteriales bacterium]MDY2601931.1 MBOAT family O-acyltransferase [Eubacteriales bacterium]